MKDKSLDYLEEWLHHHDSIEAGDEMLRRLREVVPWLEAIRDDPAMHPKCGFTIRPVISKALALVKGTAEAAPDGEGTE